MSVKKILVVEDDPDLRGILATILASEGYQVRQAENGLVAKTIIELNSNDFDLVVSDIKMPELDGIEFLKHSKSFWPNIKVILITGFSELLESKSAYDLGADGFLCKPFKMSEVIKVVQEALTKIETPTQAQPISQANTDEDDFYCKIPIEDFISTSQLTSDIFIKLSEDKYIKIAREGMHIDITRLEAYKEKSIKHFYIKSIDFYKYSELQRKVSKIVADSGAVPKEKRIKIYRNTMQIILNEAFVEGVNREAYDEAGETVKNTVAVLGNDPELFELLTLIQSHADELYSHSVAVSIYSCLIAKKMGWFSQSLLAKLAMGGLYHDIGKKEIPREILLKPRALLTQQEVALYETHPTRGRDILSQIRGVNADVLQIIYQHHEDNTGKGYPLHLSSLKIHPLAKLVHLADEFCISALALFNKDRLNALDAIENVYRHKFHEVEGTYLKALMELFNFPVPKELKNQK